MRKEQTVRKRLDELRKRYDYWTSRHPDVAYTHLRVEIEILSWVLCEKRARSNGGEA